ncbi:hypothetical protein MAR_034039 [Mya arenaria]|uniref:Uncharacterized protein n=1 Tax=Mya arenaria TaxID=6604 RepID=A0ABY7GDR9_MYAAR|nr:hypothetical protein MAR_034039 [Mya arenaria]
MDKMVKGRDNRTGNLVSNFNNCKFELKSDSCSCSWDTNDKENTHFYINGDYVAFCTQKFLKNGGSSLIKKYQHLYTSTYTPEGWCLVQIKKMVSDTIRINITSDTNGLKSIAISDNVLTTCTNSTNTYILLDAGATTCNAGAMSAMSSEGFHAALVITGYLFVKLFVSCKIK